MLKNVLRNKLKDRLHSPEVDLFKKYDELQSCLNVAESFCGTKFQGYAEGYQDEESEALVSSMAAAWATILYSYDGCAFSNFFLKLGGWKSYAPARGLIEAFARRECDLNRETYRDNELFAAFEYKVSQFNEAKFYTHPKSKNTYILRVSSDRYGTKTEGIRVLASRDFWNPWVRFFLSDVLADQASSENSSKFSRECREAYFSFERDFVASGEHSYAHCKGNTWDGGRDGVGTSFEGSADGARVPKDIFPVFFSATGIERLL